ncbi:MULTISPECIES: SDR family NAD(P)-dependent oxidoreductase [unclassified Sphingobium]|uniref:SDR family NAD(P)-dependent oxidoreductase n=1 Tax=unclassified Sphingobium TaxID=2611147 RepID=UPI000D15AA37|nr:MULTISPECIES: glucose 1-dehydrogenase [unclassified Sphingobium]MBG6120089.1 3alpha(or 20beta)-hydroxysteroid dehydrogenase [Sphingobium sp. JAI105]PSO12863.1 3-alpha-hydroxysteroid dehydrogenase [Sphingobium sp. AEW4]TWD05710.1 3alpha(or 20beta)-hydroxysteroid dehydrogenase [Sphingobium sp. AEW010]TWD23263.1 3alpha(or 20beta)-hydroxysteroid dehydrogenase [Sphingobium sp. AEW013]TWD25123.1 3alpha(or 20beta)-hydroxysteroid dehydrogenase [Sphingobium sp. AEW001]
MGRLSGKAAIVTGGAQGMGLATVRLFAREGAQVVLADVQEDKGRAAAEASEGDVLFVKLDVTSEEDWARGVAEASARFGGVDVLVNNAAIARSVAIAQENKAGLEHCLAVNAVGPFLGIQAVMATMAARGRGSIVNISSTEGLWGTAGMASYCASKWAIRGLTKACAIELGAMGIRVNSVHPGLTNTPMANPGGLSIEALGRSERFAHRVNRQPIARASDPSEVAYVSLFLASDESSYVTGAEIAVDGGMTVGADVDAMIPRPVAA